MAINADGTVTLQNRHGVIYTLRLPEIVKALQQLPGNRILDGEVVYVDETGEEKFTPCQRRCSTQYPDPLLRQKFPVKMEVFDILQAGDVNVENTAYLKRKETLHELLAGEEGGTIEYVPYEEDLVAAWTEAVAKKREGLIIKQKDSAYEHARSYRWLKVKNWVYEVCDVDGYTPGQRSRSSFFGSLVLSQNGQYRGEAGSGFNEWELRKWKDLFSDAPRIPQPYSIGESYTAVKVNVKVLVKYYQVTDTSVLRFPIYIDAAGGLEAHLKNCPKKDTTSPARAK